VAAPASRVQSLTIPFDVGAIDVVAVDATTGAPPGRLAAAGRYTLVYVVQGRGTLRATVWSGDVEAGDVLVASPGAGAEVRMPVGTRGYVARFGAETVERRLTTAYTAIPSSSDEFALLAFLRGDARPVRRLRVPSGARVEWESRLRGMARECAERAPGYVDVLRADLRVLLVQCARLATTATAPAPSATNATSSMGTTSTVSTMSTTNTASVPGVAEGARAEALDAHADGASRLVADVLRYIEANYRRPIALADVAKAVHRSRAHLTDRVRRETGRTVGGWIIERRMAEARRLLRETDADVVRIAQSLTYLDGGHFGRLFKRLHGVSPSAWRARER
jgi:AraC-like DNA-binding protein